MTMYANFIALSVGAKIGLLLALASILWAVLQIVIWNWREVVNMVSFGQPMDTPREAEKVDVGAVMEESGLRRQLTLVRKPDGERQS
jgi:hypothetical protein